MANFPEDYLPYTNTYSRNKDPYLVWESGFDASSDGHYHHNSHMTASIDSHSPASLNHCHSQVHNLFPTCSTSSTSWPSSEKRKFCGLSCGCCALTLLALVIICALATVVGFSVYLAMITNLHSSQPSVTGNFKVISGDNFTMNLLKTSSPEFLRKANKYETIIKTAFETSLATNAITKHEVYAFRNGSLVVFFRLYLDRRKFDHIVNSETRDDHKSTPFDAVFASKLLQKDLREGISQLKITGTEQIIIDIKSIKVNELEPNSDNNVKDIKTGGIASGSKALAPIKSTKDTKLLSERTVTQPKVSATDKSPIISTLPSITKTSAQHIAEPDVRNKSNSATNTVPNIPLISSTLSTTISSSHSSNETELNVFASNEPNYTKIKSTTASPKSEHKNPFLPFTRRQSTIPSVTTASPSTTNIRITTRSRLRSTTTTPTTSSSTPSPTTITTTTPKSVLLESSLTSFSSPQSSTLASNVLLKRTEIRDDGLKPPGLDFGQWRPVVPQQTKPPPKLISNPVQVLPQKLTPITPINQIPVNLGPVNRPLQHITHIPPQYKPNRPVLRIPIPIGIPMREVPRLLDHDNFENDTTQTLPKEIERHNTSISHVTTSPASGTTVAVMSPTTPTQSKNSSTRTSRQSTTTADPSMVDGFLVPMSVAKNENTLHSDLRKNKSLNVSDQNNGSQSWKSSTYSSTVSSTAYSPNETTPASKYIPQYIPEYIPESSIGSPDRHLLSPSNTTNEGKNKSEQQEAKEHEAYLVVSQATNSLKPTLNSNLLVELPKTKSPFDYYSVINETLFSQTVSLESTSNTTYSSSIISSSHSSHVNSSIKTVNPHSVRVSTSATVSDMDNIAGLPLGIDKLDLIIPEKLIRPIGSLEPAYGERLPKYIPPELYQKYPSNDIINEGLDISSDDIADEALYDDELISADNQSTTLDVINLFSLTTTTSHRMETTTALSTCMDNEFQCASGECLSVRAHCNRRIECKDGSDEQLCTCAHYLKTERQLKKICDGVIDCYDSSDEKDCSYCKENYVCSGSHVCIDKSKVCNGDNDCPNGDDESECISLVPNDQTLDTTGRYLNAQGSLYIRRKGEWAPLCLDDLNMANDVDIHNSRRSDDLWKIDDLGKAICRANSYAALHSVQMISLNNHNSKLFFKMEEPSDKITPKLSMWSSLFERSECLSKRTAYVRCKDFECGVRPVTNGIRRRIVGGQSASQGSWPWQVALYREGEFQCGGVIVASQWLLTAAHCFHATRDSYWMARFGVLRRGNIFANPYEQMRRITHVVVHPDYVDKGFINDIALLKLDSPINYSKHVRPICMPTESDDVSKWHRQLCTTVGWGKLFEHGRIFPDTLQEVKLPVISTEECRKRTLFLPLYKITDNMFCAGYDRGGRDACLGDSGGPLMCHKRNGKWFLLGVTSNGDGCGRAGRPGVYTKVAKYRDWIETIINNELESEIKRDCVGLRCPLGRCLKKEHICNGIMDCRDGSDEQNCLNYTNKTTFNRTQT